MTTLTGYSVAAAHAYDRADRSTYVEMAAGILLAYSVGSIIGPFAASAMMDRYGASFLFVFTAVVQVATLAFIVVRTRMRAPAAAAEREVFDVYSAVAVGPVLSREGQPEARPPADAASGGTSGPDPAAGRET
jgi:MFS family permease